MLERWTPAFAQARTAARALALAAGLLGGVGRRTITRALGFLDKEQQDWTADYKLFSRSPWTPTELFDPLLAEAVAEYGDDGPIVAAFDDTTLRRTGQKIPNAAWRRDPLSPPFQVNLIWGQRFLQGSVCLPLYRQDSTSSPRAVPVRFAECPAVKKPGKKATAEQGADYRAAKQQHHLSTHFVAEGKELRARLDRLGFTARALLLTGDGSFCNRTTFRAEWERTHLVCRARQNLRLCFRHEGQGRFYDVDTFTPADVDRDQQRPWQTARIFHGGKWRQVRYKEVNQVLWRGGAGRKEVRLLVLAPTAYRRTKTGRTYYRQKAVLLSDDLTSPVTVLLQAYFDHFEIEFNHRDEKSVLGVGQAQVWAQQSAPRVPEFQVAAYSALLLAGLAAYGPKRTDAYRPLPKWRRAARRPSCQDLVTLLRQQMVAAGRSDALPLSVRFERLVLSAAA